ncbi:MAG: MarR family transcriptional regulator [Spirochaetales bacterium]|nr:MarR family transcriptional regulator [Spirochaetales bacterium]
MAGFDQLKLENQLCFPLYTASRLVTRLYQPLLKEFGLTYTQYLILLVLWEEGDLSVSDIGKNLFLESNTLTPLLKRMESKKIIKRERASDDERRVVISLTDLGREMEIKACEIPGKLIDSVGGEFTMKRVLNLQRELATLIHILK